MGELEKWGKMDWLIKSGRGNGVWARAQWRTQWRKVQIYLYREIGKMDAAGFVDKKWEEKGCLGQAL